MASNNPASGKGARAQYASTSDPPVDRALAIPNGIAAEGGGGRFDSATAGFLRSHGRAVDVIEFEGAVVSFFIDAADMLGVPKSVAAIYAICFASAEPLSFADIHQRLHISQGSISQGLRILREVGALRVVDIRNHITEERCSKVGERRDYYTPDLELRKLAYHLIEERLGRQFKGGEARLQAIKAAIPTQDIAAATELQGRLKQLQGWHGKGQALLPLVKTFLALG